MRELRAVVERQAETLTSLQQELDNTKFQMGQQLRELNLVKVRLHGGRRACSLKNIANSSRTGPKSLRSPRVIASGGGSGKPVI